MEVGKENPPLSDFEKQHLTASCEAKDKQHCTSKLDFSKFFTGQWVNDYKTTLCVCQD